MGQWIYYKKNVENSILVLDSDEEENTGAEEKEEKKETD